MAATTHAGPHLWLRSETKPNEHRSALTPVYCRSLISEHGFRVTVERCPQRVFADSEFEAVRCVLAERGSWKAAPRDAYIIGLKELPEGDSSPLSHCHIFFAHCYKNQAGWRELLRRFVDGGGTLLDLEFLQDERGRRVAAFGFHAGFAGAAVGIDVWCQQKLEGRTPLLGIKPFPEEGELLKHIRGRLQAAGYDASASQLKILVIGALGRCGSGAVDFARKIGIPDTDIICWDMAETAKGGPFRQISDVANIFINCIYLSEKIPPFIDQTLVDSPSRQLSVVVDVSCDTTNPNNPIPIYDRNSTFDEPTIPVPTSNSEKPLDVVAIDHLPTLLPREASDAFCRDLLSSLIQLKGDRRNARVWREAEELFISKVTAL